MNINWKIKGLFFGVLIWTSSCTSYQSLLSYNEYPLIPVEPQAIVNYTPLKIQANDILKIQISSIDAIAVQPFQVGGTSESSAALSNYLVNSTGNIIFPTVGEINLKGLEIEEAQEAILEKLTPYFTEAPIVQVRLVNFKVNVNGEVTRPGSYSVINDRLSIIEAITLAGDFTPYSMRDSILIIREMDGMRSFGYVNFNTAEVFNSPYFYLQQNDVVYIRPEKTKVNSIRDPAVRILPWVTTAASLTALIISISRR